ncbi:olfactory receptor 5B17-like [Sebastes fasciatus]|uniref:olfactory receptor 5B17-like n=1 Tax=Sebastes fasciatus TaxID=394691 RepID=UPI003D9FA224
MENSSFGGDVVTLEGLKVSPQSFIPAFILLLLMYIFIMVSNVGLVVLIFTERSLQQPMYLLFCNMSINDVFGASIIILHVLRDLLISDSVRSVRYIDCAVQAFCVHLHASASHTVLMIMAFDRYVAICNPLRYATIMTNRMVVDLSAAAWGTALVPVAVLVGLSVRLSRCRSVIFNLFCDNASLFKLSCESVLVNNIYGLGYTVVLMGSSVGSVTLTYLKIAAVCVRSKNKVLNCKALQTCATHLVIYIVLLVSGYVIVILHRFPQLADHRKVAAVMGHVVLPALNAVIYGLQIKKVRQKIMSLFHNKKVANGCKMMQCDQEVEQNGGTFAQDAYRI